MSKNYSVLITAKCLVLVKDVANKTQAKTAAVNAVNFGVMEITGAEAVEVPADRLEQAERHADVISE